MGYCLEILCFGYRLMIENIVATKNRLLRAGNNMLSQ